MFWRAVKKGEFQKPSNCSDCGKTKPLDSHHDNGYDGDNWKHVVWLCRKCHQVRHKDIFKKVFELRKGKKYPRTAPTGKITLKQFAIREGISYGTACKHAKHFSAIIVGNQYFIDESSSYNKYKPELPCVTKTDLGLSLGITRQRVCQLIKEKRISETMECNGEIYPTITSHIIPSSKKTGRPKIE